MEARGTGGQKMSVEKIMLRYLGIYRQQFFSQPTTGFTSALNYIGYVQKASSRFSLVDLVAVSISFPSTARALGR